MSNSCGKITHHIEKRARVRAEDNISISENGDQILGSVDGWRRNGELRQGGSQGRLTRVITRRSPADVISAKIS